MPNETIVQYILNVDTDKAERGLKETARDAKMTGEAFESMGNSASEMSTKLKTTEKQLKRTQFSAKNLRKAGRDLDGALMDMAQGANLVSPAMGNLLMTMSQGSSVADGFGRVLVAGVNPFILGLGLAASAAALAINTFTQSKERAKQQAENTQIALDNLTAAMANQRKVLEETDSALGSYITDLNNAQAELAVLKGVMSAVDLERMKSSEATAQGFAEASAAIDELQEAEEKRLRTQERFVKELEAQIKAGKDVKIQLDNARKGVELTKDRIEGLDKERGKLRRRRRELDNTLQTIITINEQEKERAENEKKFAKSQREQENALKKQLAAAQKLQQIIDKLTLGELSGREKILEQRDQELEKIRELELLSNDMFAAAEAELLIKEKTNRLLDEQAQKEREIEEQRKKEQQEQIESTLKGIAALAAAPTIAGFLELGAKVGVSIGDQLTSMSADIGKTIGGDLGSSLSEGLGSAGSIIGGAANSVLSAIPIIGAATLAIGAIGKGLAKIGQKTPDERRKDLKQQAESMKKGLEFLPEILLQVLPQFALAIAEAIVDGFVLALQSFGDILRESLRLVFTREGRQERREANRGFLRDFFDPNESAAFAGGGHFIPKAEGGMRYTGSKRSGLALLHQGEFVVPQSGMRPQTVDRQMSRSSGSPINIVINSPVVEQNAVDALVRRIEERFNSNFGLSSSNLFGGR